MQATDFSQYSGALDSKSQILSLANKEQVIIPWKKLDYAGAQSRKTLGDSLSHLRRGIFVLWGGWGERKGPALFVRPHVNPGEADVLGKNSPLWTLYFENLRFRYSKTLFTHGQKATEWRIKSPFTKISGYVLIDKGLTQNRILTKSSRIHLYIDYLRQEFCRRYGPVY